MDFHRKIGRNEPCWCGSGKKYKYCHLCREDQSSVSISEVIEGFEKTFGKKICLCPEKWKKDCNGDIVKAHTVSRKMLDAISIDGHVYGLIKDFGAVVSNNGKPPLKKIGIKKASTFTGFCGKHDLELFKSFENNPFEINDKNITLLSYRALCYEYFTKSSVLELIPYMRRMDRGYSIFEQRFLQKKIDIMKIGFESGLNDLRFEKREFDNMLIMGDFSNIKYYIVELNELPSIMCCGRILPQCDFHGNKLQDLVDLSIKCESMSLSIISNSQSRGLAVFAWLGKDDGPNDRFIKSFSQLSDDQKIQSLVRFVFEHLENMYLNPMWWEKLDKKLKDSLNARKESGANLTIERGSNCLMDDGNHYVNHRVVDIFSNFKF